ncbi:MAG: iron ABC transporter permease [Rhodobacteraceae bacterium]|nr:iron ABC transporter permease [Paracoccaceae bacterium]
MSASAPVPQPSAPPSPGGHRAGRGGPAAAVLVAVLLGAAPAGGQGFAGLGSAAGDFALPAPGPFDFPADHGPHWDFRIEWWYLTAVLTGPDGSDLGVQWTLFRTALAPGRGEGWQSPQLWMGHAGLTTPDRHFVAERLARDGTGQAGVELAPAFRAWIDDWELAAPAPPAPGRDALERVVVAARGMEFAYRLKLEAAGPLVAQGDGGYSVKSAAGQASRYYSQPFYRAEGWLDLPEGRVAVTGLAWLDREWSSQPLAPDQTGWDWFSLHLDGGERMMGFRLRDGGAGYTAAAWIGPDGVAEALPPGALRLTPLDRAEVAGRRVPVRWRLELPATGLDVTVAAVNPQAWMATLVAYWEGPVRVTGSHPGRGYLEMTGYE